MVDRDYAVATEAAKSLRIASGQTKIATIRFTVKVAKKAIDDKGKIRISLVYYTIKEVTKLLTRYYKCCHTGHLTKQYKSQIDRSRFNTRE